ncbi:hypothetical protein E3O46_13730 [Cryobacterium glucosi]|uniref:ISXO2-like transposase domain-containing protein n=1 Tax=Cryobacterium glucosi TaxID=1259175 RepID=A0ABY2IK88_9MICO|nr:hypothetical protein E3O59_12125 [Cryobacterium sp. MDB2-33-2]TFC18740.1 hypothetical protein E3O46_13730 [Cryobacterium glucosi]
MVRFRVADGRRQDRSNSNPSTAGAGTEVDPDGLNSAPPVSVRNGSFVQHDPSRGDVKVDESIFGGFEPGIRGRRSTRKLLPAAAVERRPIIQGASHVSLTAFLQANIEPGSHVITDGWSAYPAGHPVATTTPAFPCLLQASLRTRYSRASTTCSLWSRGADGNDSWFGRGEHLHAYVDEWVFRLNRRSARSRELLYIRRSLKSRPPAPYYSMREAGRKRPRPIPMRGRHQRPPSLDIGHPELPWCNETF